MASPITSHTTTGLLIGLRWTVFAHHHSTTAAAHTANTPLPLARNELAVLSPRPLVSPGLSHHVRGLFYVRRRGPHTLSGQSGPPEGTRPGRRLLRPPDDAYSGVHPDSKGTGAFVSGTCHLTGAAPQFVAVVVVVLLTTIQLHAVSLFFYLLGPNSHFRGYRHSFCTRLGCCLTGGSCSIFLVVLP